MGNITTIMSMDTFVPIPSGEFSIGSLKKEARRNPDEVSQQKLRPFLQGKGRRLLATYAAYPPKQRGKRCSYWQPEKGTLGNDSA